MNNNKKNSNKEKKVEELFLKEINALINNAKEIEKEYAKNNDKKVSSDEINKKKNINLNINNNNININKEQKLLERQLRGLKSILGCLENNYGFNSPYHEELKKKFENEENMTEEISNQIIKLYYSKNFNLCYNMWKKYDFKLLLGVSPERSFDMLKYLNKIRDRYENRVHIIDSINKINLTNVDYNNYNNQSAFISNYNNISNYKDNSQLSNSDIYNIKLNENEIFTQKLRKQVDNIKRIQNLNN